MQNAESDPDTPPLIGFNRLACWGADIGGREAEARCRKLEIQSRAFIFDFYLQLILREKLTVRFFRNAEKPEVQGLRPKGQGGYELRNGFVFLRCGRRPEIMEIREKEIFISNI